MAAQRGSLDPFNIFRTSNHLSAHQLEVLNEILDILPDHELTLLWQARRRYNPRDSVSTISTVASRLSSVSANSVPSLRGPSVSSARDSMTSLDESHLDQCDTSAPAMISSPPLRSLLDGSYAGQGGAIASPASKLCELKPDATESRTSRDHDRGTRVRAVNEIPRYVCTYCAPTKVVTFKRRSDWKKHETSKHEQGKLFTCVHSKDAFEPCRESFHSLKPIQDHHETVHARRGCTRQCSATRLSRKVVFACGFRNCKAVFVSNPAKGVDAWDSRCKHVGDHFDNGAVTTDWSYSNMILNLLRQPKLYDIWTALSTQWNSRNGIKDEPRYSWSPSVTEHSRNLLETTLYKTFDCDLDLKGNTIRLLSELYRTARILPHEPSATHNRRLAPVVWDGAGQNLPNSESCIPVVDSSHLALSDYGDETVDEPWMDYDPTAARNAHQQSMHITPNTSQHGIWEAPSTTLDAWNALQSETSQLLQQSEDGLFR